MTSTRPTPEQFGPFRITRRAGDSPVGARLLAVDDRTSRSVMVHVLEAGRTRRARQRQLAAVEACAAVAGVPHVLAVEGWGFWEPGRLAWVTAYPGAAGGPVTLRALAQARGGRLPVADAGRVVDQLWSAVRGAHAAGWSTGPMDLDGVLVDPQGQVWIENYGLAEELRGAGRLAATAERRKLELLSLGAAFVELTTGAAFPLPEGLPELPELPPAWAEALRGWTEEALAGAITAALRAEDAAPAVVEVLRRAVGRAAEAERGATEAAREAGWSAAKGLVGGAVRGVLKGAAARIADLFRGS